MSSAKIVFSDKKGDIYDHPELELVGRAGSDYFVPDEEDLIELPEGSRLFSMPGRNPMGWNRKTRSFEVMDERVAPVAAFLPPAYTRLLLPAYKYKDKKSMLPLWAYTLVGWKDGKFVAAAIRVDESTHWNPDQFDDRDMVERMKKMLKENPDNRLLAHLSKCATDYHCFAAKNLFYTRWEIPLPTSQTCNAKCAGCLSLQPSDCFSASMDRIDFMPSPKEISNIVINHFENAQEPVASFGQGCEGEPIMNPDLLSESIREIRQVTKKGTINLNTNGSKPDVIDRLCMDGLDSIRFSINCLNEDFYNRYFKPVGYVLSDVFKSIEIAKKQDKYVSINLFVFPGVTDSVEEVDKVVDLIKKYKIDMIQMRNLNIDPDFYIDIIGAGDDNYIGIRKMLDVLKNEFPKLTIGYFNKYLGGVK